MKYLSQLQYSDHPRETSGLGWVFKSILYFIDNNNAFGLKFKGKK